MRALRYPLVGLLVASIGLVGCVYVAPARATSAAFGLERWRSGLSRKEATLPDGSRIVYLEGGRGAPLVLLHGFGGDKDNFTRVARFLTSNYRVIIPDLLGFGESAHPADADYSPTAQAERVRALAVVLGAHAIHLGGNSMGGQIALTYAALHPDEISSLWLLAPAGVWTAPASEVRTTIEETGQNLLLVRSFDDYQRTFDLVMSDPPYLPRPMLRVLAKERIANAALEERIFAQVAKDSIEQRVTGLKTPALIVWGDEDRALHVATGALLRALMGNATLIIMPGVGHVPMLERPRQSAAAYLRWRGVR